ncbi:MAG: hypothetical protein IID40_09070 [Planctomycetes bacterium]|nr:hypothetical protein [Planctomycetota bacterium]
MIRFAHRMLIVVMSLLAVGTAVLGIVSYNRPMGFGVLEPTWFSRAVDGYPSRLLSLAQGWDAANPGVPNPTPPSDFRVLTFVGIWGGRLRTMRNEGPFQSQWKTHGFARGVSAFKSTPAKRWAAYWPEYQRQVTYSGRPDTNWPLVRFYPDRIGFGFVCSLLEVSIWLPLALLSVYPAIAFARFVRGPIRRWRRRRKGLCAECGYDLTGNESGVCPECGKAISDAR